MTRRGSSVPARGAPRGRAAPARFVALILAAGQGKRMRSARTKLIHGLAGGTVISRVVQAARDAGSARIIAVIGVQAGEVRAAIEEGSGASVTPRVEYCTQERQLGTGHAVLAAEGLLHGGKGTLLILNGDVPLVRPSTLRSLVSAHRRRKAALTLLTTRLEDPRGYGRILRRAGGSLSGIVEQADLGGRTKLEEIREVNAGLYCAEIDGLFTALRATSRRNVQKEYYLPDLVGALLRTGRRVDALLHPDAGEVLGINSRADFARVVRTLNQRKLAELMEEGVTILDPEATYVDPEVSVAEDVILHPMVHLEGSTSIGAGSVIHAGVRIVDSTLADGVEILDHCLIHDAIIGPGARVGPFAHLRPGTRLGASTRIGNFVETKKATLGDNSKANHLAYLGDAEIGRNVNVGAGTITCNFDGWSKHRTVLEEDVFIGSDTQLVAPVTVGRGAFVGAGSTITKDVPAGSLALSRAKQRNIEGWAVKRRRDAASTPGKKGSRRR